MAYRLAVGGPHDSQVAIFHLRNRRPAAKRGEPVTPTCGNGHTLERPHERIDPLEPLRLRLGRARLMKPNVPAERRAAGTSGQRSHGAFGGTAARTPDWPSGLARLGDFQKCLRIPGGNH